MDKLGDALLWAFSALLVVLIACLSVLAVVGTIALVKELT